MSAITATIPTGDVLTYWTAAETAYANIKPATVIFGNSRAYWFLALSATSLAAFMTFADAPVANMGVRGATTGNALYIVENSAVDFSRARRVYLEGGVNDLRSSGGGHHTPAEIADGILATAEAIRLRARNAEVFVLSVFPSYEASPGGYTSADLNTLNGLLAADRSGAFTYIDVPGLVLSDYQADQLHLLDTAYRDKVAPAVRSVVRDPPVQLPSYTTSEISALTAPTFPSLIGCSDGRIRIGFNGVWKVLRGVFSTS